MIRYWSFCFRFFILLFLLRRSEELSKKNDENEANFINAENPNKIEEDTANDDKPDGSNEDLEENEKELDETDDVVLRDEDAEHNDKAENNQKDIHKNNQEIIDDIAVGETKIVQEFAKDTFNCKYIAYRGKNFINHFVFLLMKSKSPMIFASQVPKKFEIDSGIKVNCEQLENIDSKKPPINDEDDKDNSEQGESDVNENNNPEDTSQQPVEAASKILNYLDMQPAKYSSLILSLGDVFEFNDDKNNGSYNKSMNILHHINTTDFNWQLTKFESHNPDLITFKFKGVSDAHFKEDGSYDFHIQIHTNLRPQVESPKLPVNISTILVEISSINFRTDSTKSRLLASINYLTSQPSKEERKLLHYIIDKIPAVFSYLSTKWRSVNDPKKFVSIQMRPICYTSPQRQFFSQVDMHYYYHDEVDNLSEYNFEKYFSTHMIDYLNQKNYKIKQLFVSCGQPSDNGYTFTDHNVISFTVTLNDDAHEKFNYAGVIFYFSSLFFVTVIIIIASWFSIRRQNNNKIDVEMNISNDKLLPLIGNKEADKDKKVETFATLNDNVDNDFLKVNNEHKTLGNRFDEILIQ